MWFHWTKTRRFIDSLPVVWCRSAPRCGKPFSYWWGVYGPWITTIWPRPCSAHLRPPSANHRRSSAADALLIGWCFCSRLTLFSRKPRSSNVHWHYCGHWRRRNQPRSTLQPVLTPLTPMGLLFLPSSPCTQSFLRGEWLWIFEWYNLNATNVKFHVKYLFSLCSVEVCWVRNVSHIGTGFTAEVRRILGGFMK